MGSCPDTDIDPISMYFIYTVLYTFCKVLTRRICLIKSLFGDHFLYSCNHNILIWADIVGRN